MSISKDFYESQNFTVSIESGKIRSIKCDLRKTFGTIEVEALEGSEIFIDKEKVGTTTYSGRILGGVHILELRKEKHYDYIETISVEVGKPYKLKPKLDPKVGMLSIMSDPPEASIYLDNEYRGKAPLIIRDIIVGSHILKISKASFGEITKTIKIEENKSTVTQKNQTFKYQLLKTRRYRLQIKSKPSRAKVSIDGVKQGRTPITVPVSYGSHSIKLSKRRYYDIKEYYYVRNLEEKQNYQLRKQIKSSNKGRMAISFLSGYVFNDISGGHQYYGESQAGWAQLIDIKLFTRNNKISFNLTPGFFRFWSIKSEDLLMIPLFLSFDFYIYQVDVRRIGLFIGLGLGGLASVENQIYSDPSYINTKYYRIWKSAFGCTARIGFSIKLSSRIRFELGSYPYLLFWSHDTGPVGKLIVLNAGIRLNL